MKIYTLYPNLAYIIHLLEINGAHINELGKSEVKLNSADNLLQKDKKKEIADTRPKFTKELFSYRLTTKI